MANPTQKKIFITRQIPGPGIEMLKAEGFTLAIWPEDRPVPEDVFIQEGKDSHALVTLTSDRVDTRILDACKKLELIAQFGAGFDNIDIPAATRRGIAVSNTPGAMSEATADIAFGLMIAVTRKFFYMHKRILAGGWTHFQPAANLGVELKGKTLGIFGLGHIGMEMARRCRGAYQMEILYCNRNRNEEAEQSLGARWVPFDELLAKSDVLSVHSVLSEETRGIFDRHAFARMKPGSVFINTSRGGVHNEEDLIDALQKGVIWGAGLDVTNPEPMRPDNPLLSMENVCILPHVGSATVEARGEMSRMAAANAISFYRTGKLINPVNPEVIKE